MLAPVLRQLLQSFPQCSLSLVEMGRHVPEILEKLVRVTVALILRHADAV
jgi:hypothetical protein